MKEIFVYLAISLSIANIILILIYYRNSFFDQFNDLKNEISLLRGDIKMHQKIIEDNFSSKKKKTSVKSKKEIKHKILEKFEIGK